MSSPLKMRICTLIPARYKSSRLPGKPLLTINGKTIIQMVYEQVIQSKKIEQVYITTDDDRIIENIVSFGGDYLKVTTPCLNGTERICHALKQVDAEYDIIVNVQGDEPFINPNHIDLCIDKMLEAYQQSELVCTTLHYQLAAADVPNPSIGKMVMDRQDNVMYCSRSPIPSTKSGDINPDLTYYGHIGIFVFRAGYLPRFLECENTPAQLSEDIEWLKIIEDGYRIKSYMVSDDFEIGVNTPQDYQYLLEKYSTSQQ